MTREWSVFRLSEVNAGRIEPWLSLTTSDAMALMAATGSAMGIQWEWRTRGFCGDIGPDIIWIVPAPYGIDILDYISRS